MSVARPIPTVTASGGAAWEPGLLSRLNGRGDVRIVRRCVDLVDLVATSAAGTARAALVGAALHRLDRDAIARLHANGVAVVGVAPSADRLGHDRLVALGVVSVLAADADAETIAAAVAVAVDGLSPRERTLVERPVVNVPPGSSPDGPSARTPGSLVAVWGPTGAPGRTTVAVNLAAELAAAGLEVLLADADTYGASVAQVLGLLDEAPGLAAAVRSAAQGGLDGTALSRHARQLGPRLRVLTGLPRPDRWPELRPAALANVWDTAISLVDVVVVDCGFSVEQDEEIAFDVAAPRRNATTLTTLEQADLIIAVGTVDPVGLQRLIRGLEELHEAVPGGTVRVVVNKARRGVAGQDSARAPIRVLRRHAGVDDVLLLPANEAAVDAALMAARPLLEVVPRAPVRMAIRALAEELAAALRPAATADVRARHRARVAAKR